MKYIIWGGTGWIGQMIVNLISASDVDTVYVAKSRLENYYDIIKELEEIKPDRVLNCAGITGTPNVDWCENNSQKTFFVNVIGIGNLAHACWTLDIHLTNYSSGCIYNYDFDHPIGKGFTELDYPNFEVSTYSKSKVLAEKFLEVYHNVLTLRIRLPISDDKTSKNLLIKLSKFNKVINIPNSVTILPELLPISLDMSKKQIIGKYNFVNPGAITHPEILELYKEYIDENLEWGIFTEKEQNGMMQTRRCNCELDVSKLTDMYEIKDAKDSLREILQKMK